MGDVEKRERLEFVQAQVLLLMSGLNFGKRQDEVLIEFWRDTNLSKYHIVNDTDLRKRGPQFKQALIHLVSNMIEAAAASSKKDNKKAKGLAADEEEKKEAGAAAEKIETKDPILAYFAEIDLFKGLKDLKKRERDPSMQEEINMAIKCIRVKLAKLVNPAPTKAATSK